ncbi:hypothetical protein [Bradyrhizobium arachidis]|nr:hypothetical protein [Bradyrhizobium arachidis]
MPKAAGDVRIEALRYAAPSLKEEAPFRPNKANSIKPENALSL